MFGSSTPVFTFRGPMGVPVEIHSTIVLLALLFVGIGPMTPEALMFDAVLFGFILVSIFLHELGHAWGARVQGISVQRIALHGGGGFCQHASAPPRQSEFIIAMGPIVNLALWALASLLSWWLIDSFVSNAGVLTEEDIRAQQWRFTAAAYLDVFAWMNLVLGLMNMVPVQPLDGGRLFHLSLLRAMPQKPALRLTGCVGLVFSVLWIPGMILVFLNFGWVLFFFPPIWLHWEMAKGNLPA